jgi:hypothetical protein
VLSPLCLDQPLGLSRGSCRSEPAGNVLSFSRGRSPGGAEQGEAGPEERILETIAHALLLGGAEPLQHGGGVGPDDLILLQADLTMAMAMRVAWRASALGRLASRLR